MEERRHRIYAAVFLLSTATLTLEIGLTRLFSIAQGYHFSFMVISIAMLGIGAGGALLSTRDWDRDPDVTHVTGTLSKLAALFSITAIVSFIAANAIVFDPIKASWSKAEFLKILMQYLILSLPFVLSGMALAAAIRAFHKFVHRLYFSDMAGAGCGCLLILGVLSVSGGEWAVLSAAALTIISSLLFRTPAKVREAALPGAALVLIIITGGMTLWGSTNGPLAINSSPYRDLPVALGFPGAKHLETIHSGSGQLDIIESPAVRAAPGIGLSYLKPLPPQRGFTVNSGALSTITSPIPGRDLSFLAHLPSALPYVLKQDPEVFIIDPGGGMELLTAMELGASSVAGAETSEVVFSAMKGPLSEFSGFLFDRASIVHGSGRNVLKGLKRRFDVISLPRTGTLGAGSGIGALGEDYALTAEAAGEYLGYLLPGGFLTVSIYLLPPPRQELKLLSTVIKALEDSGLEALGEDEPKGPAARIMAIRSWGVLTLVVKNGRVDDADIKGLKDFSKARGFDLVWYPGMTAVEANLKNRFPEPLYHNAFRVILDPEKREAFFEEYLFDVRASIDLRPFFSRSFKMTRPLETYVSVGSKWSVLMEGGYLLPWILVQAVVASLVLIIAPTFYMRRRRRKMKGDARILKTLLPVSLYFASIGLGFIFIEIALIQRLIPVLDEPVYAVSAVLFSILVASGVGSYLSGRFRIIERFSTKVVLAVPLLVVIYLPLLEVLTGTVAVLDVAWRYAAAFAFLFPLGAAMGIPFPAGMALLGEKNASLIPWAWCVNGTSSVVGSVLVMMVALGWGFGAALYIAALLYCAAWLAFGWLKGKA